MLVVQGLWFRSPDLPPPPLPEVDRKQLWWFGLSWPEEGRGLPRDPSLLQETLASLKGPSGRPFKRLLRPSRTFVSPASLFTAVAPEAAIGSEAAVAPEAAIDAWASEAQKARVDLLAWPLPRIGSLETTLACLRSAFRGQIAWLVEDLSSLEGILPLASPDLWLLQTSLPTASSASEWQNLGRSWCEKLKTRPERRPLLIWLEDRPPAQTSGSIFAAFQPYRSDILGFLLPSS